MAKGKHNSPRGAAAIIEQHKKAGEALDAEAGINTEEEERINPRFAYLKAGRPKAIQSVEELDERMQKYLNGLGRWGLPTKAGLAFSLGISRETLNNYEKDPLFRDTINHWYPLFEDLWAQNLSRPNATGTIFFLKNAHGYVDRHETDATGRVIHYVLPAEIAKKHGVPITHLKTDEKHGIEQSGSAPALQSGEVPTTTGASEQVSDGESSTKPDAEAGQDADQHQLEEENGEVPHAVR